MFLRFCPFRASIWCFCFTYPGCRFACPGLGASLGFQPAINLSIHGQYPHFSCKKSVEEVYEQIFRYVSPKDMFKAPIGEGVDELAHGRRVLFVGYLCKAADRTQEFKSVISKGTTYIFCKGRDFLAIAQPISWRSSNNWLNSRPN